jgi:hypothetical protein
MMTDDDAIVAQMLALLQPEAGTSYMRVSPEHLEGLSCGTCPDKPG